jgi:alkanesulfonate monooxygenase SsuD/methylene tetrahydromethanopterin reductase-like flavin-dependent oxidoreductase (luciferase family)
MDYGRPVRFGLFVIPDATSPQRPLELAALADELGFDLIGIQDHPYQRRFYDTWTLLTAIAMRTARASVFPDVGNLPLRPPAVLAKAAASLDVLSGGRVELGLGAGGLWDAIRAMGGPVRTPGESVTALEEAIQVIRLMWSGGRGLQFDGQFYQLKGAHSGPVPAHPMGIWIGAYKPRMLGVVGRLADGWVPSLGYLKPQDITDSQARIDEAAVAAGREPRSIRRVANVGEPESPEYLAALVLEHGFDTFVLSEPGEDAADGLRRLVADVFPKVRELVAAGRGSR